MSVYLYHYYPLYNTQDLNNFPNIEFEKLENLLNNISVEPFQSLYRATLPIAKQQIWVSHEAALKNDPFEFAMNFTPDFLIENGGYEIYKEKQSEPITERAWQELVYAEAKMFNGMLPRKLLNDKQHYGIFCMSKTPTNTLMWSHYASSHRGICVRFKIHDRSIETVKQASINSIYTWSKISIRKSKLLSAASYSE